MRRRTKKFKGKWVNGKWLTLLAVEDHKGRKEITIPGLACLADKINPQELKMLVRAWIKRELTSHGIICDVRLYRNKLEIWCTKREILGDGSFGQPLKIWDDPTFQNHLLETFLATVNEVLARKDRHEEQAL